MAGEQPGQPSGQGQEKLPRLGSYSDVAPLVSRSKQDIQQLVLGHASAPEPVARLASGPVFRFDDLLSFAKNPSGRPAAQEPWPDKWKLAGRAEVAAILGVSGSGAEAKMRKAHAPKHVAYITSAKRIWLESDIIAFRDAPAPTRHKYPIDLDRAVELNQTHGLKETADLLGVPRDVLTKRMLGAGIEPRHGDRYTARSAGSPTGHGNPVTDEEIVRILQAFEDPRATVNKVAGVVGRNAATVKRYQARGWTPELRELAGQMAAAASGQDQPPAS
jgi:hypothetical protein